MTSAEPYGTATIWPRPIHMIQVQYMLWPSHVERVQSTLWLTLDGPCGLGHLLVSMFGVLLLHVLVFELFLVLLVLFGEDTNNADSDFVAYYSPDVFTYNVNTILLRLGS
jgi:hypothetical protein